MCKSKTNKKLCDFGSQSEKQLVAEMGQRSGGAPNTLQTERKKTHLACAKPHYLKYFSDISPQE